MFGFGGLGRFLVDGFAQFSRGGDAQMVAGVVLVALLVLTAEVLFALLQSVVVPRGVIRDRPARATAT